MEDKTTDDLSQALMSEPDLDSYLQENQPFLPVRASRSFWHRTMNGQSAPRLRWPGRRE